MISLVLALREVLRSPALTPAGSRLGLRSHVGAFCRVGKAILRLCPNQYIDGTD